MKLSALLVCFFLITIPGITQEAGLSIIWNGSSFEVKMEVVTGGNPLILGTSQVSVVIPEAINSMSINVTGLSPNAAWVATNFEEAPPADPSHDFISINNPGGNMGNVPNNSSVTLFTFTLDGGCNDEVRLFDNQNDPDPTEMPGGGDFSNVLSEALSSTNFYNETNDNNVACMTLPVDIRRFHAKAATSGIDLLWDTVNENNLAGYEVQRSMDGLSFSKIAWIPGKGGTAGASYEYGDQDVQAGLDYYYRLKMLDQDGSFNFSPVRSARIDSQFPSFSLYPNPASGELNLVFEAQNAAITSAVVWDNLGRQVLVKDFELSEGKNIRTLDVGQLPEGVYHVQLSVDSQVVGGTFLKN